MMTTNSIIDIVENKVAKYIGTKYAIVCSSARNAIRFALLALGVKHNDEVVIPDFACGILPITVFCTGARPALCDIDRKTCAMTPESLKKAISSSTKAAIIIHPLGLAADAIAIKEFAEKRNIFLVEDAAQSLGTTINGQKTGSIGNVGVLSFNKFLNCNLGGAAVTNDKDLADKIKAIKTENERKAFFPYFGYTIMNALNLNSRKNMKRLLWADSKIYRFSEKIFAKRYFRYCTSHIEIDPDILRTSHDNTLTPTIINQLMTYGETHWHRRKMENAELHLLDSEIGNLERKFHHRIRVAKEYDKLFENNGIDKIPVLPKSVPAYLRYPLLVHDTNRLNELLKKFDRMGFIPQAYRYKPLHSKFPAFGFSNKRDNFPNSIYVSEHILLLPIFEEMSYELISKIASIVNDTKTVH